MKKIDVLILYEHKNRELESAVRLSVLLEQKGITSEIRQCGWDEAIAEFSISPSILVVPWCYDSKDLNKWKNYKGHLNKKNRLHILNLHCEQVVFSDAIDFYLPKGEAQNIHHISWGPNYTNLLIKQGIENKLIHETGSTRLDFFKKQYCTPREDIAKKYNLDINKKWVLLVGNFSAMYFNEESIEKKTKRGVLGLRENKEIALISFNKICNWYQKLLDEETINNNIEFIYRPHPSEGKNDILLKFERKYNNFHYIADDAIRDWYMSSELAFVWTSTSSVEAYYSEIPVKALRPIDIPDNIKIDLVEKLDKIKNYEEFRKIIYDLIENKKITTNIEFMNEIEKYYGKMDIDAGLETVKVIKKLLNTSDGSIICHKFKSFESLKKAFNYFIKYILNKLRLDKEIKKWEFINRDRASNNEIKELKQKYRNIEK